MKHEEITRSIIGAAMAVLNELKPGLDEKLCENALLIEFEPHISHSRRANPLLASSNKREESRPAGSFSRRRLALLPGGAEPINLPGS